MAMLQRTRAISWSPVRAIVALKVPFMIFAICKDFLQHYK